MKILEEQFEQILKEMQDNRVNFAQVVNLLDEAYEKIDTTISELPIFLEKQDNQWSEEQQDLLTQEARCLIEIEDHLKSTLDKYYSK